MESSHVRAFACAAAVVSLLVAADADACKSDKECKGARICQAGKCADPEPIETSKSKGKKAKKPVEPSEEEKPKPALVEEPPAPPRAPKRSTKVDAAEKRSSSPWAGASHAVGGTINLVGGYGARVGDNVYYGLGAGLQAGVLTSGGAYFGLRAHEYVTNSKSFSDAYSSATAEGRSSYYAVEVGFDSSASKLVVVRMLLGLGILRVHGTVTGEVLGTPVSTTIDDTAFCMEPSLAIWFRVTPDWFLGPQMGLLMGVQDGLGIGAANLTLGAGYAW